MPDLDGISVAKKLEEMAQRNEIKATPSIIMVTGFGSKRLIGGAS